MRIRGLISSKQYWQCMSKTLNRTIHYKIVVKKFLDQKSQSPTFEARNERTVTGTPAKSKSKGKSVSAERQQGDRYQWKARGKCTKGDSCSLRHAVSGRQTRSVQEEMLAIFATIRECVENHRAHSLLLQNRRRKMKGKVLGHSEA